MLNKQIIIGRLTRDPELKTTTSGISVVSFSVAVNRNYVNKNGERDVDFFDCIAYRKLAEIINQYCTKGMSVAIEGSMQSRFYENKNKNNIKVWELIVNNIVFLEKRETQVTETTFKKANEYFKNPKPTPNDFMAAHNITDDDLPF